MNSFYGRCMTMQQRHNFSGILFFRIHPSLKDCGNQAKVFKVSLEENS
jgi:hypothetical protein